jgi:hypothetical protein
MIVLLGFIVGFIVIAMFLPMIEVYFRISASNKAPNASCVEHRIRRRVRGGGR